MEVKHEAVEHRAVLRGRDGLLRESRGDLCAAAGAVGGLGLMLGDADGDGFGQVEDLPFLEAGAPRPAQAALAAWASARAPVEPMDLDVIRGIDLAQCAADVAFLPPGLRLRFALPLPRSFPSAEA